MIDTNVRSIKRTESGATILNKATAKVGSLCNHCAMVNHCEHRAHIVAAERSGKLTAPVTTCNEYHYPIHFVSTVGIDAYGFNTMRLGEAWSKRLKPGDMVGLLNHDKQLVTAAQVKLVEVVSLDTNGLLPYASHNHMVVHEPIDVDQAADKLLKILRNNYDKLVFERNRTVTVIGF
jgi:hypothetical protein